MANLSPQAKSATLFQVYVDEVQSAYDLLESDLDAQVRRMRAMGMSEAEIFKSLSDSLNNGLDMFQTFKGAIGGSLDTLLETTSQLEANDFPFEQPLVWMLDPTAQEHCGDCVDNSESGPRTFDEWSNVGLPGAGNTECGPYCKCSLEPA